MATMSGSDEFNEFETTEAEFDAMMAVAQPVEVDSFPAYHARLVAAEGYYTVTRHDQPSASGTSPAGWAPRQQLTGASPVPSSA